MQRGAPHESRIGKNWNFQPKTYSISEIIRPWLLWRTNRKYHMRFRPWLTLTGRCALDCRKDASFGAQYKPFNEDRPICQRWDGQGCSLGLDVSVSRRSRDAFSQRLGLVLVSEKCGNVSVSVSSWTESQTSRSRLGLGPQGLVYKWHFSHILKENRISLHSNSLPSLFNFRSKYLKVAFKSLTNNFCCCFM